MRSRTTFSWHVAGKRVASKRVRHTTVIADDSRRARLLARTVVP